MNKYEVLYILDCGADDAAAEPFIERFNKVITDNGGTVDKVDKWGQRRLAYPINFKNEGYYVLLNMTCGPDLPSELERNFRIVEEVRRYMVVRLED